eukprot:m.1634841 g.1634841  ORF g.1634841 m.1634841 type:complete len:219 (-) comp25416_c1_seq4:542-1198(-)
MYRYAICFFAVSANTLFKTTECTVVGNTSLHLAAGNGHDNVVDILLHRQPSSSESLVDQTSRLVDSVNSAQQTPAAIARDSGYTALANRIEQLKRQAILLQDGVIELKEGKLLVCGFERVGKTTLVQALKYKQATTFGHTHTPLKMRRSSLKGTTRTAGFDVSKFVIPLAGDAPWTVVDFAGHVEYYVTHEMLLSAEHAIFIVMCNLEDDWTKQWMDH